MKMTVILHISQCGSSFFVTAQSRSRLCCQCYHLQQHTQATPTQSCHWNTGFTV